MDDQESRLALITGGGTPIGRLSAEELLRRGWSVFLQTAPGEDADALAADLRQGLPAGAAQTVSSASADLADAARREQLVEQVLEESGRIDLLLNVSAGAGSPPSSDLLEMTEDQLASAMRSGLTGTLFLTQLVANEMVRLVEGGLIEQPKIVTINSLGAYTSSVDHGPSCLARAALGMMTRLFADRLGEHGINVYEICCGILATGRGEPAHARYDALIAQGLTPIRRWGRPDDVARAVSAVAEGLLDFSTGETINVDGGFHLRRL